MIEVITKLSKGIYDTKDLEMVVSSESINLTLPSGSDFGGSFEINSKNGRDIKGIIYSNHAGFKIVNDKFRGSKNTINYKVCVKDMEKTDDFDGELKIISNGGEKIIPFHIEIKNQLARIGEETIQSLEDFAKLASTDYDTAFVFFASEKFGKTFLKDDIQVLALYEGLMEDYDKKAAMEEFLIELGLKNKIFLDISQHDDYFEDVFDDVLIKLNIKKTTWGYEKIDILCDDEFIELKKSCVTTNDFIGNECDVSFIVRGEKLHSGKNFGRIVFRCFNQVLEYNICIYNAIQVMVSSENPKKTTWELLNKYIMVRTGKMEKEEWIYSSLELLQGISEYDENSFFLMLYKAQILLNSRDRQKEASNILEYAADFILEQKREYPVLYCYYLYVRCLEKGDDEYLNKAIRKVKEIYEDNPENWKLYWVLLHLQDNEKLGIDERYARIKYHFYQGCKSPIMYYEALELINTNPDLVRILTSFELQILSFGAKWDCLDIDLIAQVTDIAKEEKNFNPLLTEFLLSCYDKKRQKPILEALVTQLICGNKTAPLYHGYYAAAIDAELKIVSLFEHYIASLRYNDYSVLPKSVLMYFAYNTDSLHDYQSYLFANIVKNKENIGDFYRQYVPLMERYAVENLSNGVINDKLAIIYEDILTDDLIKDLSLENIGDIVNTFMITVDNPDISEVVIYHKELAIPQVERVKKGIAYAKVYTDDPIIIFRDVYGGMHGKSIKYGITKLFGAEKILKRCILENVPDRYMLIAYISQFLKFSENKTSLFERIEMLFSSELIRDGYKVKFIEKMVDYFYEFYDDDAVVMFVKRFFDYDMSEKSRTKITELMIMQGLYEEARDLIEAYNVNDISPNRAFKLCAYFINTNPEIENDQVLTGLCLYALENGKYNDDTLKYLSEYYEGTIEELLRIYEASKSFDYENINLLENIIVHSLFADKWRKEIGDIFEEYFKEGFNKTIKIAYISSMAYEYVIRKSRNFDNDWKFVEALYEDDAYLSEMVKIAYIKYFAENIEACEERLGTLIKFIKELSLNGIMLNCYRNFIAKGNLPFFVKDSYVVEYEGNSNSKYFVNYTIKEIDGSEKIYEKIAMKKAATGLYFLEITMFEGQILEYEIIEELEEQDLSKKSDRVEYHVCEETGDFYGIINAIIKAKMDDDYSEVDLLTESFNLNKVASEMYFDIKN